MKKFLLSLFAVLFTMTAMADKVKLSKCNGGVSQSGLSAQAATLSAATEFTVDDVSLLAGGKLTSIRVYLSSVDNMKSLELWVKNKVTDARALASCEVTNYVMGWNEIELAEPVDVTGTEPLVLGYTYGQSTSNLCYAISRAEDTASTNGLLLSVNGGTFMDYSAAYGNLSIEGIVDGITIEGKTVIVSSIELSSSFFQTKSTEKATVTYGNKGSECKSVTLRLTCGGKSKETTITKTMSFSDQNKVEVEFQTPDEITGSATVTAAVVAIDGEAFDGDKGKTSAEFGAFDKLYDRTVVIEEGTGTWCGYCVRGIVAMEQMREKYPDSFIGIAAHSGDEMEVSGYAGNLGISSFPGCTVDRRASMKGVNVDPSLFEEYYRMERARRTYADFTMDAYINEAGKAQCDVTATFDYDQETADVRITTVLVEDGVTGYAQSNYYAGGGLGSMGGFESKPQTVKDIVFNDVARKLYPSFAGNKGSLTKSIVKGEEYKFSISYAFPKTLQDKDNLTLVALMLDGKTGEIINAHKMKLQTREEQDGIESTAANAGDGRWYNINGTAVNGTPNKAGLYILNGKKIVVK